jgi:RecA/RadA recombinase
MIRRAMERPLERPTEPLRSALATLQSRWGSAVVRLGDGASGAPAPAAGSGRDAPAVHGALALAQLPDSHPEAAPAPVAGVISTGFPALDAILGPAGLPPEASVVMRGGPSSGKTTLALRTSAEAQGSGDIVAWLDLGRSFDPGEAVCRGVDLRWLLVIRPTDVTEGLALAGSLLAGRCVGLLVVDLPARLRARTDEPLRRIMAQARRVGARLLVLEPASLGVSSQAVLAGGSSVRLDLERHAWLRLGRDVVGQRTRVAVAKNRYGPPGRSVDLDIHYLMDGERTVETHRWARDGLDQPIADGLARPLADLAPLPAPPLVEAPSLPGPPLVEGPPSAQAGRGRTPAEGRPRLVAV